MTRRHPLPLAIRISLLTAFGLLFLLITHHSSLITVVAQSASATLSGTVVDQNGAVVPAATVTVLNTATSSQRKTTSTGDGDFVVPLLPPGNYSVRVEHDGFMTAEIRDVVLNVGDQKAFQVRLKTGNISETVNITAETPLINESPAVGTVVDRQFVANIPLNGRSFQSLIALTPGVIVAPNTTGNANAAGQFSVNGQRASANGFTVDGVSANFAAAPGFFGSPNSSGNLPALTTFGTTQSLVSVDALQEFKVQTSTYAAEYGRQPGGQISIVTRAGTNQFHGSAFDYLRNDKLDANDWFANRAGQRRPPERQNDFGGTFSGPVLLPRFGEGGRQPGYNGRNRTFFFFSYEGLRLRQPNVNLTNVPTLCLRGQGSCAAGQTAAPASVQSLLNAFPLPNGKDLGNGLAEFTAGYSNPSNLDATSIRIDHTANNRLTLFARYNKAPSQSVTRRADIDLSGLQFARLNNQTITVGATASLTPRVSNDLRVNYSGNGAYTSTSLDNFGGATPPPRSALIPSQYDLGAAQGTVLLLFPGRTASGIPGLFVSSSVLSQRQFNIVDNVSYALGSHQFKFGMDYRRLIPVVTTGTYVLSSFFSTQQQVIAATAGSAQVAATMPTRPIYLNFSAYGQDTWRVSRRLTVDLGVRWDVNPAPSEVNGKLPVAVTQINNLATMQLAPLGTKEWKTTYDNFAPRLGLAYQISQAAGRETVVRGGFGVFYDTGNDYSAQNFTRYPYLARSNISNFTYPFSPSQVAPPPSPIQTGLNPPYPQLLAFDPALRLPHTLQWNVAIEQSVGRSQAVTVSYVGTAGRKLLQETQVTLTSVNPSFTTVNLNKNSATSDYDALQAQFQRRLSRGLQALASYTWSHALDDDSAGQTGRVARRGNADFDIRHVFAAAATYDISVRGKNSMAHAVLGGWSLDASVHAQSALPVDLVATTLTNPADGSLVNVRPNVIAGIPLYLSGPQYPGGRTINNTVPTAAQIAAAGCSPTGAGKGPFCTPPAGQSGNFGRNQVRGLGAWQVDSALRRQFKLTEKLNLQFRAEGFNIFNHPNFGAIQTSLTAANFGQPTNMLNVQLGGINQLYQFGGPRSFQFALKLLW